MANRSDRLHDALYQERNVIAPPESLSPAGWGIGFYQGGEVLHKKRPLLEGEEIDWEEVASEVHSDCAVFHLRNATVGKFRSENTHPFRFRQWLFAHNGTIGRFDVIRQRLLESMPDFLQRNIRGETDSEHFFHAILSFLHDAGQLDQLDLDERAVLNSIRSTVTLIERLEAEVGAKHGSLNMMLTNGRRMYALCRGAPLMYVERQGLHDTRAEDEPATSSKAPQVLRYLLAVSDGPETPRDYETVEDGSVLVIDRDLNAQVHAL
jgi:glutamine amidotransferase